MAAGLAMTVAQISRRSASNNARVQSSVTLANLRNQLSVSGADPLEWLGALRDNVAAIRTCLTPPGPYVCPAATNVSSDTILTAEAAGRTISAVDLYDLGGQRIAGGVGSEVYFDREGLPCASANAATDTRCMYRATGYMIRQNLNPVPDAGQITFIRRLEQTAQTVTKESPVMAPLYEKVTVGRAWASLNLNGPEVGTILAYGGDPSAVPGGFLLADGSAVAIVDHPQLYAALGSTWGTAPTGSFRLPDLRGYFARGAGGANPLATKQAADLARHNHVASVGISGPFTVSALTMTVNGSLSALSGSHAWFNSGGGYDGHAGYGTQPGLSVSPIGPINGINITVAPSSANITFTGLTASANAVASAGTPGETRPSNSAVLYILRDDYE